MSSSSSTQPKDAEFESEEKARITVQSDSKITKVNSRIVGARFHQGDCNFTWIVCVDPNQKSHQYVALQRHRPHEDVLKRILEEWRKLENPTQKKAKAASYQFNNRCHYHARAISKIVVFDEPIYKSNRDFVIIPVSSPIGMVQYDEHSVLPGCYNHYFFPDESIHKYLKFPKSKKELEEMAQEINKSWSSFDGGLIEIEYYNDDVKKSVYEELSMYIRQLSSLAPQAQEEMQVQARMS